MKTSVTCVCALLVILTADLRADEAPWRAAAGSVVITPDQPVWMGGYAARDEPSRGKVHDLKAKVLVVQDGDDAKLAIVTVDLLGITLELRAAVEDRIAKHGFEPHELLMNASHTHCGPELRADRMLRFGIDPRYAAIAREYVQVTAQRIADLIVETFGRRQASRLTFSRARAGFAMNRRLPTESGFINSPNPSGPVDHDCPVLRVEDADGKLTAVLFGYSCHATTLSFQQLCGDWPGFAQRYVEDAHEGVTALFLNGCSADQNPYPRRSLELAQQHGRALANGVETALETRLTRPIRGPLRVALENATLKFAGPPTRQQIEAEAKSSNKYSRAHGRMLLEQLDTSGKIETEYSFFPIQVAQFGDDLTLVAICGEVVVDYALRLKSELPSQAGEIVWVAGYSNHVFGYLPSLRVLKEGGYEGGSAMRYTTLPGPFDDSVEDRVVSTVHRMVDQLRTK